MNRMILSTLVLPSLLGLAQAAVAVEPKPMNPSVALLTEAATTHASLVAVNAGMNAEIKESVRAQFVGQDFVQAALRQGGTLEYAFKGDTPMQSSVPRVTKAVEVDLSPAELAETPAVTSVTLRAIVDENGIPRNVSVTKSGGAKVDQKAIAALQQYRFAPATIDNQPTWSSVVVTIKIQK